MRTVPALTASTTAVLGPPASIRLHPYVRLIKFRYHLSYATVVFGAVIYPGTSFGGGAGSLALLYVLFNVLLYGGIYTLNDVADLESDRLHPSKRRRPIASGEISEDAAVSFAVLMILAALAGGAWAFGPVLAWTFVGFLGINAFYSCFARNVPVLDLAFNSLTHPMRFVMGAALAGHGARVEHVAIVFVFALGVASLRRTVEKAAPGGDGPANVALLFGCAAHGRALAGTRDHRHSLRAGRPRVVAVLRRSASGVPDHRVRSRTVG